MTFSVRNKRFFFFFRLKRRLRYSLKKAYQLLISSGSSRPVFILGSGRSGTDIVAHCLSRAWETELFNEDNPKVFDNWRVKELESVRQAIRGSYANLVLFKPIVETLRAMEFLECAPDSAAVFVIRNPYDAINSMRRFFGGGHVRAVRSWVETDFAEQQATPQELRQFIADQCQGELSMEDASGLYWLLYNKSFSFLGLDSDPRVILVRYEDLVQNPDKTMQSVCGFLGLNWRSSMTDEVYSASVGKNPKPDMSPEIERACLEVWESLTGEQLPTDA